MLTGLGKVTYTVKVTQQRTTENADMAQPQSAATIFVQNKTMLFASVGLKSLVRDLTVLDDFITDYDSIFSFEEEEYQDNIDNPGDIKVTCDYTELEKQFVQNKTKALKQI